MLCAISLVYLLAGHNVVATPVQVCFWAHNSSLLSYKGLPRGSWSPPCWQIGCEPNKDVVWV